jgi:hypothetical protein
MQVLLVQEFYSSIGRSRVQMQNQNNGLHVDCETVHVLLAFV